MKHISVSLLLLAFAIAGLAITTRAQQEPAPQEESQPADEATVLPTSCASDRLLVKVGPGADPAAVISRYGGSIVQTIPGIEVQVVTVPAGQGQQAIASLSADPEVQYAEPDGIVQASGEGAGC